MYEDGMSLELFCIYIFLEKSLEKRRRQKLNHDALGHVIVQVLANKTFIHGVCQKIGGFGQTTRRLVHFGPT